MTYVIQEYVNNQPGERFFRRWETSLYGEAPVWGNLAEAKGFGSPAGVKPFLRRIRRHLAKGQQAEMVTWSKASASLRDRQGATASYEEADEITEEGDW